MPSLTRRLLATLPARRPGLFNPWAGRCRYESAAEGAAQRIERLERHLDCEPRFILVGEAPGYQGCRYSGVPFTSERQLLEGGIPRMPAVTERLSTRRLPFAEPSATIVWRTLHELGLQQETVLWNALQLHPHRPRQPWSNRPPTNAELTFGVPALQLLRLAFPTAIFVPVGKKAEFVLRDAGIPAAPSVRHPANGGASAFARGLRERV